jgi:hypothetical protein
VGRPLRGGRLPGSRLSARRVGDLRFALCAAPHGRWNLAVQGRKLAGTAQAWRRFGARQVVLAHAVIVVGADPAELTERANAIECDLGRGRPYRADALTSLARAAPQIKGLEARTLEVLAAQLARFVPPRTRGEEKEDGPARIRDGPAGPG